jgi:ATP-dependent DNA helicase RecQ
MKDLLNTWRLRRGAKAHFGWARLRPEQLQAMRVLLRHGDALVVLPTGAGKSAVYQLPAVLLDGPTVVVSPLLALQEDQIAALNARDNDELRAVRVSSAESAKAQEAALAALAQGRARFLFITPEQLRRADRLAQVQALRPALVAVDEAHCISAWGHDFRPDYLSLGHAIDALARPQGRRRRRPPVVALTATASPPVREDIATRLHLREPSVIITGLDRPNIFLEAIHCPTEDHRWRRLLGLLDEAAGAGIVYGPTRRGSEELARRLRDAGHDATAYHGGMGTALRTRRHEDFLADRVRVMVATSAFGMGIDKPNIRWVVHVALPDSPDSYLQEIGRAGRDGEPARALLLHRGEDVALQRYFAGGAPDEAQIRDLVALLRMRPHTRAELHEASGLGLRRLAQLIALLEEVGAVEPDADGRLASPDDAPLPAPAARLALAEAERHQTVQRTRIDMMRRFAESRTCRGQALLAYFGDTSSAGPCGHCDNCGPRAGSLAAIGARPTRARSDRATPARSGRATPAPAVPVPRASAASRTSTASSAEAPFPLHSTVRHPAWGLGTVLGYEKDQMTVLFDAVGYKTLSVPVVRAQGLLAIETG